MKKMFVIVIAISFAGVMSVGCSPKNDNPTSPLVPVHTVEYRVQSPNAEFLQINWTEATGAGNSSVAAAVLNAGTGWTKTVQITATQVLVVASYPDTLGGHLVGSTPAEINAQIFVDGTQVAQGNTVSAYQGPDNYVGQLEVSYDIP